MEETLEVRRVWSTTMQLLGFDSASYEDKFHVKLEKDMFKHINKKGSEVVMHFLFNTLDSHAAYEEFRDCWPIFDKKQETQFRKACSNWLARIAKDEPSSRLPRLASSLLLSPGGDKFYYFLLRFSSYVLKKVLLREAKQEEKQVYLPSFITAPESHSSRPSKLSVFAMKAHIVRHTNNAVKRTLLVSKLHKEWETYASQLTEEYRAHSKEAKQLTKKLNGLQEERRKLQVPSVSTPGKLQASEKMISLAAEVADQKRRSRMEKVRSLWRSMDSYYDRSAHERETVSSVLHGHADTHTVDAKDIAFQVPDMLLKEYEALNREGKVVGNTYEGGKLNIISLIQLWNCSLKVLRDEVSQKELPSFEAETEYVGEALDTQRANLTSLKSLRVSLSELQYSLESQIEELEVALESLRLESPSRYHQRTGQSSGGEGGGLAAANSGQLSAPLLHIPPITVPTLGLDLLPPSPKKQLPTAMASSERTDGPHQSLLATSLSLRPNEVSTPEAVHNISHSVLQASRLTPSTRHHTSKLRAPQVKVGPSHDTFFVQPRTGDMSIFEDDDVRSPTSASLQPASVQGRNLDGSVSDRKTTQTGPLKPKVIKSSSKSPFPNVDRTASSSKKSQSHLRKVHQSPLTSSHPCSPLVVPTVAAVSTGKRGEAGTRSRTQDDKENDAPLLLAMPNAHDILADQIAAAVADGEGLLEDSDLLVGTPEASIHSFADPISAMGTDAFVVRDRIPRTPVSKPVHRTAQGSASPSARATTLGRKSAPEIPSPLTAKPSTSVDVSSLQDAPLTDTITRSKSLEPRENSEQSSPRTPSLDAQPGSQRNNLEQSGEGLSPNKSPPPLQLSPGSDKTPPTPHHSSMSESYSPIGEVDNRESDSEGEEDEKEGANEMDRVAVSGQPIAEGSPLLSTSLQPSHSSGSTTPEFPTPPLSQSSDVAMSKVSSMTASSKKVAFGIEGGTPSAIEQVGSFSPGSLNVAGAMLQTPPSSSYHISQELPPTPFQYANFDLDSSYEEEEEEEVEEEEKGSSSPKGQPKSNTHFSSPKVVPNASYTLDSVDANYFRKLDEKVVGLITQDEIEPSTYEMQGSVAQLVDLGDPSASGFQVPAHHDLLTSSKSLKVEDLLDSLDTEQPHLQSPLRAYHSPPVDVLVDISTPGSSMASRRPLMASTAVHHSNSSSNPLAKYLTVQSGAQSSAGSSAFVNSDKTWSWLKDRGSPSLASPPVHVLAPDTDK